MTFLLETPVQRSVFYAVGGRCPGHQLRAYRAKVNFWVKLQVQAPSVRVLTQQLAYVECCLLPHEAPSFGHLDSEGVGWFIPICARKNLPYWHAYAQTYSGGCSCLLHCQQRVLHNPPVKLGCQVSIHIARASTESAYCDSPR